MCRESSEVREQNRTTEHTGVFDLDRHHREDRRRRHGGRGTGSGRTGAVRCAVAGPARPAARHRRRAARDRDRGAPHLGPPAPAASADPDVGLRRTRAGADHRGPARTAGACRVDQPDSPGQRVPGHLGGGARPGARHRAAQHRAGPRRSGAEQGRRRPARVDGDAPARSADGRRQRRLGRQRRRVRRRPAVGVPERPPGGAVVVPRPRHEHHPVERAHGPVRHLPRPGRRGGHPATPLRGAGDTAAARRPQSRHRRGRPAQRPAAAQDGDRPAAEPGDGQAGLHPVHRPVHDGQRPHLAVRRRGPGLVPLPAGQRVQRAHLRARPGRRGRRPGAGRRPPDRQRRRTAAPPRAGRLRRCAADADGGAGRALRPARRLPRPSPGGRCGWSTRDATGRRACPTRRATCATRR